ncbi:unnamed protein product, partial [Heterosigma akashiwo]
EAGAVAVPPSGHRLLSEDEVKTLWESTGGYQKLRQRKVQALVDNLLLPETQEQRVAERKDG